LYGLEGRELSGWSPEDFQQAIGPNFADPTVPGEIVRRVAEEPLGLHRMEFEILRPVCRIIERVSAPVLGEAGQFLGQVVLFHEITALREIRLPPVPSSAGEKSC